MMKDIKLDCECDHIKGISCNVKNCKHNAEECYCTAEKINVGPISANTISDTICATFKPKNK